MLDHGKFAPAVVLTDVAKGFAKALQAMKECGWHNVRHLYCRWHIYEAIKRHCGKWFNTLPKGMRGSEMNRFIDGFKNVVVAPNQRQMQVLWVSIMEEGKFPQEAVDWVFKEYYNNPKAPQFMECYVYDCGNLHQTTTS